MLHQHMQPDATPHVCITPSCESHLCEGVVETKGVADGIHLVKQLQMQMQGGKT